MTPLVYPWSIGDPRKTMMKKVASYAMLLVMITVYAILTLKYVWGVEFEILNDIVFVYILVLGFVCCRRVWRLKHFHFATIGIEAGDVLQFEKNSDVTCVVAGKTGEKNPRQRVVFAGDEMNLTDAARIALHDAGFTMGHVEGAHCWEYEGRSLHALAMERELERSLFS